MSVFPYRPEDIYHLAATIFAEAAGEPWEGKVGVGYVARRRAELAGVSIPDVVYGSAGEKYGQFSAWNPNDTGYSRVERGRNSRAWDESVRAAFAVLRGTAEDPTNGATHYTARYVNPAWAKKLPLVAKIGNHNFHKEEDAKVRGLVRTAAASQYRRQPVPIYDDTLAPINRQYDAFGDTPPQSPISAEDAGRPASQAEEVRREALPNAALPEQGPIPVFRSDVSPAARLPRTDIPIPTPRPPESVRDFAAAGPAPGELPGRRGSAPGAHKGGRLVGPSKGGRLGIGAPDAGGFAPQEMAPDYGGAATAPEGFAGVRKGDRLVGPSRGGRLGVGAPDAGTMPPPYDPDIDAGAIGSAPGMAPWWDDAQALAPPRPGIAPPTPARETQPPGGMFGPQNPPGRFDVGEAARVSGGDPYRAFDFPGAAPGMAPWWDDAQPPAVPRSGPVPQSGAGQRPPMPPVQQPWDDFDPTPRLQMPAARRPGTDQPLPRAAGRAVGGLLGSAVAGPVGGLLGGLLGDRIAGGLLGERSAGGASGRGGGGSRAGDAQASPFGRMRPETRRMADTLGAVFGLGLAGPGGLATPGWERPAMPEPRRESRERGSRTSRSRRGISSEQARTGGQQSYSRTLF